MATVNDRKNGDGSKSFVAQVRVKGFKPTSKTFNARDFGSPKDALKAAEAWGESQELELRNFRNRGNAVRGDVATLTFGELVTEYLKDESATVLATFNERQLQLAWFVNRYGNVRAIEFANPVRLRDARDQLRKDGAGDGPLGPSTANRYFAAVRKCWNWGRSAGLVPKDSVWPPGLMLTEPKGRKRYLTGEELTRALNEARKDEVIGGELLRCAVMFAVGVGCRQSELLRVRWQDINEKASTVAIHVTKTDTSRRTHLPPAVGDALKALRTASNVRPLPSAYVFADAAGHPIRQHSLVDAWQRLRTRAGLPDVRWHDLRHSAASFLVQAGATLAEVANQLGHRNTATTARYAHLVEGAKPTGADALNEKLRG
jgi:integrase